MSILIKQVSFAAIFFKDISSPSRQIDFKCQTTHQKTGQNLVQSISSNHYVPPTPQYLTLKQ